MLTVYITKGLPASGKSTWALQKLKSNPGGIKRINKDLLREMLDGGHWSKGNEKFIVQTRDALIWQALEEGKHVIVDDTNLNPSHVEKIQHIVDTFSSAQYHTSVQVKIIDFTDVSVEECIKRDANRPNYVGEKVIRDMYDRWLRPIGGTGDTTTAQQDPSLPHCLICDLDGTLAILNERNPYDGSTCFEDDVNEAVSQIVHSYAGDKIFFFSGRMAKPGVREATGSWLIDKVGMPVDGGWSLHMREDGDTQKDSALKEKMYMEHIKDKFYVDFVLDDRNQVVKLWRDLGLTCLQVRDGNF